jgi:hypothetical protein
VSLFTIFLLFVALPGLAFILVSFFVFFYLFIFIVFIALVVLLLFFFVVLFAIFLLFVGLPGLFLSLFPSLSATASALLTMPHIDLAAATVVSDCLAFVSPFWLLFFYSFCFLFCSFFFLWWTMLLSLWSDVRLCVIFQIHAIETHLLIYLERYLKKRYFVLFLSNTILLCTSFFRMKMCTQFSPEDAQRKPRNI